MVWLLQFYLIYDILVFKNSTKLFTVAISFLSKSVGCNFNPKISSIFSKTSIIPSESPRVSHDL